MARSPTRSQKQSRDTVLLAVTGMSPAVLTETIWALAHQTPPVVPTKVIAVTTRVGREAIERELFSVQEVFGDTSVWESLRLALEKEGIPASGRLEFGMTGDHIRVFTRTDAKGHTFELVTVTTEIENQAAADFLLEQVRSIVERPDTCLIASIAGGYKTMSALLYACVSLLGREEDRVTHVLVNDPFDKRLEPGFYFPSQPAQSLKAGVKKVSANSAAISLANVPFVPLRNLFPRHLGKLPRRFMELVESCREKIDQVAARTIHFEIHRSKRQIKINGESLAISPSEHAALLFIAIRAKEAKPPYGTYKGAANDLRAFIERLRKEAPANDFSDWRHKENLPDPGEDDRCFTKPFSTLGKKLRTPTLKLLEQLLPCKGRGSLDLPPGQIELHP
jgi:CRISPR-associated protein (TIGR02584 family)